MLESKFQQLIGKIIEVENTHWKNVGEKEIYSCNWEFIFADFDGWTILNISNTGAGGYWIHPVLYPASKLEKLKEQLPHFDIRPLSAAYGHVMSGDDQWIEPYWEEGSDFDKSEIPLFFRRHHDGRPKGKENYIEFNQIVTHPLGLHWSPTKHSYCSMNDLGEEVEKIKLINTDQAHLILIRRRTLDKLLHLGKWALVRYFAFERWRTHYPAFDSSNYETFELKEYEGKFEMRTCGKDKVEYIEFRGAQIERPITPKNHVLSWRFDEAEESEKQYASFIVQDWKNGHLLKNYSIAAANFANYFTKSDLPFEMSTIFFNAEVLDKYKGNPDKYELDERTISCRGGWYLQTYDINEHNQVHTYAIYLSRLPYKEQLHWAQYNEEPKGAISKRSFQSDFEGKFPNGEPKLHQLKRSLEELAEVRVGNDIGPVWSPKGGSWKSASKGLFYVNTENPNQWHDFVIALANATIEGFQRKPLAKIGGHCGNKDEKLGTLGLMKIIIQATGNEADLSTTHAVLNDLQRKRGKGKAHGTWDAPEGSLIEDAEKILVEVTSAINKLTKIFNRLSFDALGI